MITRAKLSSQLSCAVSMDSLEFSEPGVGDDGSQYGREVTEAAESVVDGRGQVLIPAQVADEVERQHRCEGNTQEQAVSGAPSSRDAQSHIWNAPRLFAKG